MKPNKLILAALCVACLHSCEQPTGVLQTSTGVTIQYPDQLESVEVVEESLVFTNATTGEETTAPVRERFSLPQGLYNCVYTATITYRTTSEGATSQPEEGEAGDAHTQQPETVSRNGRLTGKLEAVEITGDQPVTLTIETFLTGANDDFVIQEIFFTGTLRPSGSQYYGDSYVKIYNNTDHVLYADGLALCESRFKSTLYFDYTPDIRRDTFTVWAVYVIPGSGTDHPVPPGGSLLICDTGIDHRNANPNSFDLSGADFEWYDISTSPSNMDINSPTVPDMDKWYCYTLSFWVLHNRGFCSYALARIPEDKETYLRDYYYTYEYTQYLPAGTFHMQQSAYKIPNAWIVDGVNCSVEAARVWDVLPASVDAGWTHCGTIDHDKTRYFKSVRRKVAGFEDGRCILQDMDNSTEDFNTECIPSVVEEQGTAIDAQGTKATTRTWDGVMPMEGADTGDTEKTYQNEI